MSVVHYNQYKDQGAHRPDDKGDSEHHLRLVSVNHRGGQVLPRTDIKSFPLCDTDQGACFPSSDEPQFHRPSLLGPVERVQDPVRDSWSTYLSRPFILPRLSQHAHTLSHLHLHKHTHTYSHIHKRKYTHTYVHLHTYTHW